MSDEKDLKISISYKPLFELLSAMQSSGPELREIIALSGGGVEKLTGKKTCLTQVLDEFNAEVQRINQRIDAVNAVESEELISFSFTPSDTEKYPMVNCSLPFTDVDLLPLIASELATKTSKAFDRMSDQFVMTHVIARVHTTMGPELVLMKLPDGGKSISTGAEGHTSAFSVKLNHMGCEFALEAFMAVDPETANLKCNVVSFTSDQPDHRLPEKLGLKGDLRVLEAYAFYAIGSAYVKA